MGDDSDPDGGGRLTRRQTARLILVIWTAALGWLAVRTSFPSDSAILTSGAARLAPDAKYFRVDIGNQQLGVLNAQWDTLPAGFRIFEMVALDLPTDGAIRRQVAITEATTTRGLNLRRYRITLTMAGESEELAVQLARDTGSVIDHTRRGWSTLRDRRGFAGLPTTVTTASLRTAFGGRLVSGTTISEVVVGADGRELTEWTAVVGDAGSMIIPDSVETDSVSTHWVTVTYDTVRTWELRVTSNGLPERWWIDESGRLVVREYPFGATIRRLPFEYSHTAYADTLRSESGTWRAELSGVSQLPASSPALQLGLEPRRYLVSRSDGPAIPEAIAALAGGRQTVSGDTITIHPHPVANETAPTPGRDSLITGLITLRETVAAAIDGSGAVTPHDSLAAMTTWVAEQIAVDPDVILPVSPRDILRLRHTNAAGKAALLTALARAAGWPARTVSGVAVTPQGLSAHHWTEVWHRGWVAADPTLGQFPASAQLVRLVTQGPLAPIDLLLRAGALRLESLPSGEAR